MSERVVLGRFASVYGVKGWIRVNSYTDPIEKILEYPSWQVKHAGQWQPITLEDAKPHGGMIVAKIQGIDDRDIVKKFTNDDIAVERGALPELEEGEFYWKDLIGMRVLLEDKTELGVVDNLLETGSNDILVVKGEKRRLIPYTDDAVLNVDKANKTITVCWDPEF